MHKTRSAGLFLAVGVLIVTWVPSLLAAPPEPAGDRPALLRLKPADLRAVLPSLAAEGYDIPGVDLETGTVDVIGNASDVTAFAARGIPATILRYLDEMQLQVDPQYLDPGEVALRL